jgi:hypothetical protein
LPGGKKNQAMENEIMRKSIFLAGFMMMLSGTAMASSLDISMSVKGPCRNPSMDVFIDGERVAKKSDPTISRRVSPGRHEVRVKAFCGKPANRKHIGTKSDIIKLGMKKNRDMHFNFVR